MINFSLFFLFCSLLFSQNPGHFYWISFLALCGNWFDFWNIFLFHLIFQQLDFKVLHFLGTNDSSLSAYVTIKLGSLLNYLIINLLSPFSPHYSGSFSAPSIQNIPFDILLNTQYPMEEAVGICLDICRKKVKWSENCFIFSWRDGSKYSVKIHYGWIGILW